MKLANVDRIIEYITNSTKGTRDLHYFQSIRSMEKQAFEKKLAYCCFCVDCNFSACEILPWTKNWELKYLSLIVRQC